MLAVSYLRTAYILNTFKLWHKFDTLSAYYVPDIVI